MTPKQQTTKKAQAARRLRKRLESQQAENDKATKDISKPLRWFFGAAFIIGILALVIDIIAGLWQWFVDILTGIPLWMLIIAIMAAVYTKHAAKGDKLRRKIRKLREIEEKEGE